MSATVTSETARASDRSLATIASWTTAEKLDDFVIRHVNFCAYFHKLESGGINRNWTYTCRLCTEQFLTPNTIEPRATCNYFIFLNVFLAMIQVALQSICHPKYEL